MGVQLSLVLREDSLMTKMMLKQESQVIEHIEEEKVEINLPINQMGDTLLHYAAYKSMKRLIEYLLERSADPNLPNNRFLTPIDVAVPEIREWMIRTHQRLVEERAIARRSPKALQQDMMMMESKTNPIKKECRKSLTHYLYFFELDVNLNAKAHLLLLFAMKNIPFRSPPTLCAFHQTNPISHFCRYSQCLLPLCRECLSIHRKQHSTKQSPIDLIPIEEQGFSVFRSISQQVITLDQAYTEIVAKWMMQVDSVNSSNQLHGQLKSAIFAEKEALIQAINLYYDSLLREVDLNFQRRHKWLQDISNLYHSVRQEMLTIQQRLQGDKHLRTIIMWNRLRPEDSVSDLLRHAKRHLEPPSYVPCDIQKIISIMSQSQSMVVLDLQGDMGFSQLAKLLYTLRFGPEESSVSSTLSPTKPAGISLISRGSIVKSSMTPSQRLILSKSADRL